MAKRIAKDLADTKINSSISVIGIALAAIITKRVRYYMKRFDVKHTAYHVLVGVYFVWLLVFGALLAMTVVNALGSANRELSKILVMWIFFNLVMGTVLFIVIRLFRNDNLLSRIIFYTYYLMAAASVTTVLIVSNK